jgi:uncharacterized protein
MNNILKIFIVFLSFKSNAQNIAGQWNGVLEVQGTRLNLVFHISQNDSIISIKMDSPDQGAKGISVPISSFENSVLKLSIPKLFIEYEGNLDSPNTIKGIFTQNKQEFSLNLSKKKTEQVVKNRPQEPKKPYPYYSEDIIFENTKDKILLAGTLSIPDKNNTCSVVILISGSGAQNRDEEMMGHKPFLVLADYLTRNGIGVFRFDDRGIGESKGDFKTATSLDFASDVEAAVNYLKSRKEIDNKKIGLIGHSEGGIIAPIVATKSKDINFIVLLAGTGISGSELLLLQKELIERTAGKSENDIQQELLVNKGAFDIVNKQTDTEMLRKELMTYFKENLKINPTERTKQVSDDEFVKLQVNTLTNPWMQFFLRHNPSSILSNVKCPVLALNGTKDLQVPYKINLLAIKEALEKGNNKKNKIKELTGLNHLFQECTTGSIYEYAKIEQTISPIALKEILSWIQEQIK